MPLTEFQQQRVEFIRQIYGDTDANDLRKSLLAQPGPLRVFPEEIPREGVGPGENPRLIPSSVPQERFQSDSEVLLARQGAIRATEDNIMADPTYTLDRETAGELARRQVSEVANKAVDVHGRTVPLASKKKIEELAGAAAWSEAFRPQVIETAEMTKKREEIKERELVHRNRMLDRIDKEISADVIGDAREAVKVEKFHETLKALQPKFIKIAGNEYFRHVGEEPEGQADIDALGKTLWLGYIKELAPELHKQERPLVDDAIALGGAALKWALTEREDSPGGRFEIGTIAESTFATGIRDLGGLTRIVVEPTMQWLYWEMDANGDPIDEDEFAFKAWEALPKAYREGFFRGSALPLPFQPVTRTAIDQDRPSIETNDMMRDIAYTIANGKFLGDDLMAMPLYQEGWAKLGYPNAPWWIGLGIELFLDPFVAFKLPFKAVGVAAKGARLAEAATHSSAVANAAGKAAEMAEIVADPMERLRKLHAIQLAEDAGKGLAPIDSFEGAKNASEVSHVIARHVADEAVMPQVAVRNLKGGGKYVDPAELGSLGSSSVVRNAVAKATNQSGKIVRRAFIGDLEKHIGTLQSLAEAGKVSSTVARAMAIGATVARAGGPVVPISARIGKKMEDYARILPGASRLDIEAEAVAAVAKESVRHDLLDMAPRLYGETIIKGDMIVSRKAWDTIGEDVSNQVKGVMAATPDGSFRSFENPGLVAEWLTSSLGPEVIAGSEFWKSATNLLKAGKKVHENVYAKIHRAVLNESIYRNGSEAVGLQWSARAQKAAVQPLARRIQTLRSASEVGQFAALKGLAAGRKLAPKLNWDGALESVRRMSWTGLDFDAAKTPHAVGQFMEATNARLVNNIDDMKRSLADLQKAHLATGASRKVASERALQDLIDDAVDAFETNIKGDPSNVKTFEAWRDITAKFLGPNWAGATRNSDPIIKQALGLDPAKQTLTGIPKLTPAAFADLLGALRKGDVQLQTMGLKTRRIFTTIQSPQATDDIFAAFAAFIAEQRAQRVVRRDMDTFLDLHPEVKIQLHHPLELEGKATAAIMKDNIIKGLGPDATPGVIAGSPTPSVVRQGRLDAIDKMMKTLPPHVPGAPAGTKLSLLQAFRDAVSRGRILSPVVLKKLRETLSSLDIDFAAHSKWFDDVVTIAKVVDEDLIVKEANEWMRLVAAKLTPDQRMDLFKQAMAQKIATKDLHAMPTEVINMSGGVAKLFDDDAISLVLRKGGVPKERIEAAVQAVKDTVWQTIASDADQQLQGLLHSWGFTHGDKVAKIPPSLVPRLFDMAVGPDAAFFYGSDHANLAANLQKAIGSGGLDDALAELRITGNEQLLAQGWMTLGDIARSTRRIAVSGTLGGIVAPITRFHGLNFITAPAIAIMTSGWHGMKNAAGIDLETNMLANWVAMKFGARADDIVFTSDTGLQWSRKMVEEAVERNNVRFSQVSYEFHEVVLSDLKRAARVDKNMAVVANNRQVMRWIDPRNKNFWNGFAETSDNYWRQNIFVSALKAGKTEETAAIMARNALLDYGAIPGAERKWVSTFVLFWAFQRQMAGEVAREMLRGGNKLRQMAVWHRYQHEHSKTWAFGKDYEKTRLYSTMGPTFDRVSASGVYGPGNPGLEAFNQIADVIGWSLNSPTLPGAAFGLVEFAFTPEIRYLKELVDYGPDERSVGYMPPHQVAAMMRFGVWDDFSKFFNVTAKKEDRRRPGDPTFNGMQFEFDTSDDYNRYLTMMWGLTRLGMARTLDDYSKLAVAAGEAPEGAEMKHLETANPILQAFSIQTPMKLTTQNKAVVKAKQDLMRELKQMMRESQ